jgi:hypothetical protein
MVQIPLDSQVTNLVWPKRSRLFATHRNGTVRVFPIRIGKKLLVGDPVSMRTSNQRILFCGIKDDQLMCTGSSEMFTTYRLPKEKVKKDDYESVLDPFEQRIR